MSPFRPVMLKSHRHPGDPADPDGVAGAAGLGIGRVHVDQKRGGGGRNPAGQAEHFQPVADQVGGLGGERAGRAVEPGADQAAVGGVAAMDASGSLAVFSRSRFIAEFTRPCWVKPLVPRLSDWTRAISSYFAGGVLEDPDGCRIGRRTGGADHHMGRGARGEGQREEGQGRGVSQEWITNANGLR